MFCNQNPCKPVPCGDSILATDSRFERIEIFFLVQESSGIGPHSDRQAHNGLLHPTKKSRAHQDGNPPEEKLFVAPQFGD